MVVGSSNPAFRVIGSLAISAAAIAILPKANTPSLMAQAPTSSAKNIEFEVASVRSNKTGGRIQMSFQPGGGFTAINVPLGPVIRTAYGVHDFQIAGGPNWLASERFDLIAKTSADLPVGAIGRQQTLQRLRTLLAERFKLRAHTEKRKLPVYALVLARRDGKLGPRMRLSTTDCSRYYEALERFTSPKGPPPTGPHCGMKASARSGGPTVLSFGAQSMSAFVASLPPFTRRSVLDRTGLAGAFDMELEFVPDQGPALSRSPLASSSASLPELADGPSLVTAIREQLGLRLEPQLGPVEVLVIDHVERPDEN